MFFINISPLRTAWRASSRPWFAPGERISTHQKLGTAFVKRGLHYWKAVMIYKNHEIKFLWTGCCCWQVASLAAAARNHVLSVVMKAPYKTTKFTIASTHFSAFPISILLNAFKPCIRVESFDCHKHGEHFTPGIDYLHYSAALSDCCYFERDYYRGR